MTPSTDEKLKVVEDLIEHYRWARDMPDRNPERRVCDILRAYAKELQGRREGMPSVAEVALGRRVEAVRRSKTAIGYEERRMVALAEDVLGRWSTIVQALRLFDEVAKLRAAINRYRYAYRWWQSDSYDVGGEMKARFGWAAAEDMGTWPETNEIAEIGHEFLRASGRSTINGQVMNERS